MHHLFPPFLPPSITPHPPPTPVWLTHPYPRLVSCLFTILTPFWQLTWEYSLLPLSTVILQGSHGSSLPLIPPLNLLLRISPPVVCMACRPFRLAMGNGMLGVAYSLQSESLACLSSVLKKSLTQLLGLHGSVTTFQILLLLLLFLKTLFLEILLSLSVSCSKNAGLG